MMEEAWLASLIAKTPTLPQSASVQVRPTQARVGGDL